MPLVSIHIPQMGEGLREVRLVARLKNPGDNVKRDEPLYQMETDKAIMDIESPHDGVLMEWLAKDNDILAVGAPVATINTVQEASDLSPSHSGSSLKNIVPGRIDIPPRTRAYAKSLGIPDTQLLNIPSSSPKLTPQDIDAWLGNTGVKTLPYKYEQQALSPQQRLLSSRLIRGAQLVVPGTMTVVCRWEKMESTIEKIKSQKADFQPSVFTLFAFGVAQTLRDYPVFRSTLIDENTVRTYKHCQLGIAVALPNDNLVLAVVENADDLDWKGFATEMRNKIELARKGQDQASQAVTISITSMQKHGIRDAVPLVVAPAVATLFIGEAYQGVELENGTVKPIKCVNFGLTFDHRLLNGVGAAEFLNAVRNNIENIDKIVKI